MASKEEWFHFIEEEESEMFALDLIEDIISNSQKVLFSKKIDAQILPYTVTFAEEAMNDMINFYYFQRDPGNVDATLWIPDDEPECVRIDSWAPASVPIKKQTNRASKYSASKGDDQVTQKDTYVHIPTPKNNKHVKEEVSATMGAATGAGTTRKPQIVSVPAPRKLKVPGLDTKHGNSKNKNNTGSVNAPQVAPAAKSRKNNSALSGSSKLGKLDSALLVTDAEKSISEENKKLLSKIMANAAENGAGGDNGLGAGGKVDYTYDIHGRIVPLSSTTSWNPIQEVKYKIVNSANSDQVDESKLQQYSINPLYKRGIRGTANGKGSLLTTTTKKPKSKKAEIEVDNSAASTKIARDIESADTPGFQDDPKLSIPLLANTMKIVPGVTLREGEVVKTAPSNDYYSNIQRTPHTAASKDISLEKGVFETSQIKILEEIIAHSKPVTAAHHQL